MTNPVFGNNVFSKAVGFNDAPKLRRFETTDIVRRLGVITPRKVVLKNYPVENPTAVFNAAVTVKDDKAFIIARIVMGYFLYVSAIVSMEVPLQEIYDGTVSRKAYEASIVLYPSTKYDIWGAEDPRAYEFDGKLCMTYTGRTSDYFKPVASWERTLPVTAVLNSDGKWVRKYVHVMPESLRKHVISDKDAFLARLDGEAVFLHRPHMDDNYQYLTASRVKEDGLAREGLVELEEYGTTWVMPHAPFELKLGWSAPIINVGPDKVVALAHGVDNDLEVYRALAVLLKYSRNEGFVVEAVTPTYIMEPRDPSELFGDRPYTIFPCGVWMVDKEKALITYGAGDYMVGIGELDINELLGLLDKGRIY